MAASILAEENPNLLVVGVQGCWGWRDAVTQEMNRDLIEILGGRRPGHPNGKPIKNVRVIFDADLATNPDVWNAGDQLRQALKRYGLRGQSAKFASLAFLEGTQGLDDYLGAIQPADRHTVFRALLDNATAKLPPSPRPKSHSSDGLFGDSRYVVDMEEAQIVEVRLTKDKDDNTVVHETVILKAAAVITESHELVSHDPKLPDSTLLFLEVAVPGPGGVQYTQNGMIDDADLHNISAWLTQARGGYRVHRPSRGDDRVAQAIRDNSPNSKSITVVPRMGWELLEGGHEPVWVYLASNGGGWGQRVCTHKSKGGPRLGVGQKLNCETI